MAPCGRCRGCINRALGQEVAAALFEVLRAGLAFRLDLTFEQDLPFKERSASVRGWLNVLQKRLGKGGSADALRYLCAWEYGPKNGRLHAHVLLCFSEEAVERWTGKVRRGYVNALRTEARARFGLITTRLIKHPRYKLSGGNRGGAEVIGYAVKDVVGYAVKDRGRPALVKGEANRHVTKSQGWGKSAVQALLDSEPFAPYVAATRQVCADLGLPEPTFEALYVGAEPPTDDGKRRKRGQRFALDPKRNPLPPPKIPGAMPLSADAETALRAVLDEVAEGSEEVGTVGYYEPISPNRVAWNEVPAVWSRPEDEGTEPPVLLTAAGRARYLAGERLSFDPQVARAAFYGAKATDDAAKAKLRQTANPSADEAPPETRLVSRPRSSYASLAADAAKLAHLRRFDSPEGMAALVSAIRVALTKIDSLTPGAAAMWMHCSPTETYRAFDLLLAEDPSLRLLDAHGRWCGALRGSGPPRKGASSRGPHE